MRDSLKGLVSSLKPSSLDDAFEIALRLEVSTTNNKSWNKPNTKNNKNNKFHKKFIPTKDQEELKKKNVCFKCKKPWEPGHNYNGKRNTCRHCGIDWVPGHRCEKRGHIQRIEEDLEEEEVKKKIKCDKGDEEEGEEYGVIATMTQPSKN